MIFLRKCEGAVKWIWKMEGRRWGMAVSEPYETHDDIQHLCELTFLEVRRAEETMMLYMGFA